MNSKASEESTPSTAGSVREALELSALLDDARSIEVCTYDPMRVEHKRTYLSSEQVAILSNAVAALSAPVAVTVGPLVWGEPYLNEINETAVNAHSSCGRYIASDHGWFLCGLTQWNEAGNIESAKAAAQADYEQRIRSALIATPHPLPSVEPTPNERFMPRMLILDDLHAVCVGGRWDGWKFYRHPDGQWVSLEKLKEDRLTLLGGSAR